MQIPMLIDKAVYYSPTCNNLVIISIKYQLLLEGRLIKFKNATSIDSNHCSLVCMATELNDFISS